MQLAVMVGDRVNSKAVFYSRNSAKVKTMHELLSTLSEIVGPEGILSGKALAGRAAGIWSNEPLQAMALVQPASTEEVAAVLKACHAANQPIVPVGGMTGLVGAHRTGADDIALSLERRQSR
jgi:FAD/FMN-containing dehydrogenase